LSKQHRQVEPFVSAAISTSLITPDDPRWAHSLASAPFDVYNTAAFVRLEAARVGGRAVAFLATAGACVFQMPLLLRPIPFAGDHVIDAVSPYGYPGIVLSPAARADPGFVDDCITMLGDVLRDMGVCSVFGGLHPLLNDGVGDLMSSHPPTASGWTVSIDLRLTEAEIWAGMSKGHKNATNQARRAGFEMEVGRDRRHIDAFVTTYRETMKRLGAAPTHDLSTQHLEGLAGLDEARVAVASIDGQIAGAYLVFECGNLVQMHLGGTRTAYMRPSPSHLLIHGVALWAKQRGNATVHLGGGVGASDSDSLFKFKSGFSSRRHRYHTLRLISDESAYCDLLHDQAARLGCRRESLLESGYFPAYRAAPTGTD
jgi:hypothetical protein